MVIFNLLVYLFINSQCHDINFDWILIRVPILICSAGNNYINVLLKFWFFPLGTQACEFYQTSLTLILK
jgi:hypothetical protein